MQRWREAVCIASGPSLTDEDCEAVRRWREAAPGRAVLVTNTTFRRCPWADVLYGIDEGWWKKYLREVRAVFHGELVCPQFVNGVRQASGWNRGEKSNSGAEEVSLAAFWGAQRIVLLGFDFQHTEGRRHWHGDHPDGLGNADSVAEWPAQFEAILPRLAGVEVINATRRTALTLFRRMSLKKALARPVPTGKPWLGGGVMRTFATKFRGVRNGEIHATLFKPGDLCPEELVAAADSMGVLVQPTTPKPAPAARKGRTGKGKAK